MHGTQSLHHFIIASTRIRLHCIAMQCMQCMRALHAFQVKDLIAKYRALPEKDQTGLKGASIIKQLKAVPDRLTSKSHEAIARLEVSHNLRQIALAIQPDEGRAPSRRRLTRDGSPSSSPISNRGQSGPVVSTRC
jgi:hypothetical protein